MDNKRPTFSVIVPVYNVEDFLGECLDSLLEQTFRDFEVIVVDDTSTDSSLEIARGYAQAHPEKIRVVEHPVNKGLGGARNSGIDAAQGKYFHFLDSDDYLKADALEKLYEILCRENADIVEFDFACVAENGAFLRHEHCSRNIPTFEEQGRFVLTHSVSACNKVFRRELFTESGVRFPEKRYYEDYWTTPKLLMAAKKAVSCGEALYCYRQRGTSIMHDTNIAKTKDIMSGTDALMDFLRQQGLWEEKLPELESLATEHVLLNATLRVNCIDPHTDMQAQLKAYMQEHFPNYRRSPFLCRFSNRERRLLKLIDGGHYGLVHLMWYQRNRLSGAVKRVLRKCKGN